MEKVTANEKVDKITKNCNVKTLNDKCGKTWKIKITKNELWDDKNDKHKKNLN